VVHLDPDYYSGKKLVIRTVNNSAKNCYIQSASFNGEPLPAPSIDQATLVGGGELLFELGPEPNKQWGPQP
jgi:putative alpha-1,2-mannosidase